MAPTMSDDDASEEPSPREQTAAVCDEIRDELGLREHKGSYTLTQSEKRTILSALKGDDR